MVYSPHWGLFLTQRVIKNKEMKKKLSPRVWNNAIVANVRTSCKNTILRLRLCNYKVCNSIDRAYPEKSVMRTLQFRLHLIYKLLSVVGHTAPQHFFSTYEFIKLYPDWLLAHAKPSAIRTSSCSVLNSAAFSLA